MRRLCQWIVNGSVPQDKIELGNAAKRLLDDPVLVFAFDRIKLRLRHTWENTPIGACDAREAAYRQVWALEEVKRQLRQFLADASLLQIEADRASEVAKKRRMTAN